MFSKNVSNWLGKLHPWMLAARPRTLILSVLPVLVGSALAYHEDSFKIVPAVLCFLFSMTAQIVANWGNDYFDFMKGADGDARKGPMRAVANGWVTPRAMFIATVGMSVLSFLIGLSLVFFGGWILIPFGILALAAAWFYSAGPYPLGWNGLGDVFVIVFFGLFAVEGTYYIQTNQFSTAALVAGLGIGLMINNVLVAAYTRDIDNDKKVGKLTLAVRFGREFAHTFYNYSAYMALFFPVALWPLGWNIGVLLPLVLLPLVWREDRFFASAHSLAEWLRLLKGSIYLSVYYAIVLSISLALH
jgi:1,4-dihydroxy-2-naphthoate polyprenyltransferase